MRARAQSWIGALVGAAAGLALAACSASPQANGSTRGVSNAGQAGDGGSSDGKTAVQTRGCPKCHGNDLAGSVAPLPDQPSNVKLYAPNLTFDATGLAAWSDIQIKEAIIDGVDNQGLSLCPQMKHYKTMPDDEVNAIIAYMHALPPVKKQIPGSLCPPLKGD